ncbi:thiamine phosphate synthase [Phosphitispora fastidiosa]|uniref:thiamine phosphate synthase n=1 Tax=Phosphitispora fastidiosa TaxID=2837202 RepID=UPI001E460190|nr:thiamine phosphate synthase [Phosphitispora fastidiosa]MBU7006794.1 thiamine-phosphate pyrophosphorylase [Phosphitispora fastidiosa]
MPKIFVITNRTLTNGRPLVSVIREAAATGADAVILREKDLAVAELYELGAEMSAICTGTETKLIINSSVETAIACNASGIHLGTGSLPLKVVRAMVPEKIVGVSVHSTAEALQAQADGADYVLAGHVFPTRSKPGLAGRGLDFISSVKASVKIPVIAIGGINPENAAGVIQAGANGIAVMSLVMEATDITGTIKALRRSMLSVQ